MFISPNPARLLTLQIRGQRYRSNMLDSVLFVHSLYVFLAEPVFIVLWSSFLLWSAMLVILSKLDNLSLNYSRSSGPHSKYSRPTDLLGWKIRQFLYWLNGVAMNCTLALYWFTNPICDVGTPLNHHWCAALTQCSPNVYTTSNMPGRNWNSAQPSQHIRQRHVTWKFVGSNNAYACNVQNMELVNQWQGCLHSNMTYMSEIHNTIVGL